MLLLSLNAAYTNEPRRLLHAVWFDPQLVRGEILVLPGVLVLLKAPRVPSVLVHPREEGGERRQDRIWTENQPTADVLEGGGA